MIVLTLTNCPPSLRGELTRWLLEIDTGVYVGKVSARVRDQIWKRIQDQVSTGRATMVFSSGRGEQGLDFRTHNAEWEPVDFDGLKLVLRPSMKRLASRNPKQHEDLAQGFSKAAKIRQAKRMSKKSGAPSWRHYAVIDVETTGLSPEHDEMMEIGAIKVREGQVDETFHSVLKINGSIPPAVSKLTGLTDDMLQAEGKLVKEVMPNFLAFVGELPVVTHNGDFDYAFLRSACEKCGLPPFSNRRTDTMSMAKRYVDQTANFKLETLVEYFQIPVKRLHRSLDDCFATMQLFQKLNEIRQQDL